MCWSDRRACTSVVDEPALSYPSSVRCPECDAETEVRRSRTSDDGTQVTRTRYCKIHPSLHRFETLEKSKNELGMEFYAVSQATLDQVFLNIVTKHNVQEENYQREHAQAMGAWGKFKKAVVKAYHDA